MFFFCNMHAAISIALCILQRAICMQYLLRCNIDSFLLNKKGLESMSILPKNFCNMYIARRNMHIAIEFILPLTYGPHHTPMLRRCIIAGTKERFEGHTPPQHPQNYIRLLGGSPPINLTRRNETQRRRLWL